MVSGMVVHHDDGGPRIFDVGMHFSLEELEELNFVGRLAKHETE